MKKQSNITRLVALADCHAGLRVGLCNPSVILYNEGEHGDLVPYSPQLTAAQVMMWERYTAWMDEITAMPGIIKLVINGDLTHGVRHPQQIMSNRAGDQVLIAASIIEPWIQTGQVGAVVFIAGTAVHNGAEASQDIETFSFIQHKYPKLKCRVMYHGSLTVAGVEIDVAHHGPGAGLREWLRGNVAALYLRDRMMGAFQYDGKPADLYLRAHVHQRIHVTNHLVYQDAEYTSTLVGCLPLCLVNEYARQRSQSPQFCQFGLQAFTIASGHISEPEWYSETVDLRTKEEL